MKLLFSDPSVMPNNNACDNGNVSHHIHNISDTKNISINSLASSEGEGITQSDILESSILVDDTNVILNEIKAKNADKISHCTYQY